MAKSSGDPVPSISEADAQGAVAALYGDIRATLGVPVVNLIWRHLAVYPGGLAWAWESLKPLYESGAIEAGAAALRAGLALPVLSRIPSEALRAIGLADDDMARIIMVLQAYERSNAMNMVALGALRARLDGDAPAAAAPPRDLPPSGRPPVSPAVAGEMPVLLAPDAMPPHVRALVEALNRVGARDQILASMYRHLAHWPGFLALVLTVMAPLDSDGRLGEAIDGVIADGRRRAAALAGGLGQPQSVPSEAVRADIRRALELFAAGPIARMIAIVPMIRHALPLHESLKDGI